MVALNEQFCSDIYKCNSSHVTLMFHPSVCVLMTKTLVVSYIFSDVYQFFICVEWNECHNFDTVVSAGCSEI